MTQELQGKKKYNRDRPCNMTLRYLVIREKKKNYKPELNNGPCIQWEAGLITSLLIMEAPLVYENIKKKKKKK